MDGEQFDPGLRGEEYAFYAQPENQEPQGPAHRRNSAHPSAPVPVRQEALDVLADQEAVADLQQSREDFAAGDTHTATQVRAELEQRRRLGVQ